MRVGISEYVATLRIQQACTLLDQGFTSVKDIAFLCGYNDPLYFSKVFKAKTGVSPREYQKERRVTEERTEFTVAAQKGNVTQAH